MIMGTVICDGEQRKQNSLCKGLFSSRHRAAVFVARALHHNLGETIMALQQCSRNVEKGVVVMMLN